MLKTFLKSKILGISSVVPNNQISSLKDLEPKKAKRLERFLGISKKCVVSSDNYENFILGFKAAKELIEKLNIDKNTIDALIYINQNPDFIRPATGYIIHELLGLNKDCIVLDATQGCIGFVYGLYLASSMIESGAHNKILLITSSSKTEMIPKSQNKHLVLFGDAGASAIIEKKDNNNPNFFSIDTFSEYATSLISPFYSVSKTELLIKKYQHYNLASSAPYMNGELITQLSTNLVPKTIEKLLDYAQVSKDKISHFIVHQANAQIVNTIANTLKIPASTLSIGEYGNTTLNSVALEINAKLGAGILDKNNGINCLFSSFGNGFTIANAILDLSDTFLSGVIKKDVKPTIKIDDFFDYWIQAMLKNNENIK